MLYFALSECLERVVISYIAVLSSLEQLNDICTVYRLYALRDPPVKKYALSNTQPKSIFLGCCSHHVLIEAGVQDLPGLKLGIELWIRPEIG